LLPTIPGNQLRKICLGITTYIRRRAATPEREAVLSRVRDCKMLVGCRLDPPPRSWQDPRSVAILRAAATVDGFLFDGNSLIGPDRQTLFVLVDP